jgi:hypothetical protein
VPLVVGGGVLHVRPDAGADNAVALDVLDVDARPEAARVLAG